MGESIWIAELKISRATAEKIAGRHGITGQEVKDAVVAVAGLRFAWNEDPQRGRRAIIETFIRGRVLVIVRPRPLDAYGDSWTLVSAYPVGR
jgi:hypothetical protein